MALVPNQNSLLGLIYMRLRGSGVMWMSYLPMALATKVKMNSRRNMMDMITAGFFFKKFAHTLFQ